MITFALFIFAAKRLLRYLRYFQQEEYNATRFLRWIWKQRAFDRRGSLALLVSLISPFLSVGLLITLAILEEDPRVHGKLRLKMTDRAKRLYLTAYGLFFLAGVAADQLWSQILLVQLLPITLVIACFILSFDEKKRQQQYLVEAKVRLAEVAPFVIGITGSYGKTSTKDALGRLLQVCVGATFWPPKSINTPMGITREIRTHLKPGHKFAIIEMGAYGRGSIARLCALTPPQAAIITCVGSAHLERFGSEETIRLAKAELADAVPEGGILVCNGDNKGARAIAMEHPKHQVFLYGFDKSCDCWISNSNGNRFTIVWKGELYEGQTALLGKTALSNAAAAFTMACALGGQPELAIAAIGNLEPVENRLQIQRDGEITYIQDAYNSNPAGFKAALDVLKEFPCKRRLLMTPGMIELGPKQSEENENVGRQASTICDIALIVGETNRAALTKGLGNVKTHFCATRTEAFACLKAIKLPGDLILIENDLPDLYETKERF